MTHTLRRNLGVVAISGLFALPCIVNAGLGQIDVESLPGEQFRALIPITDIPAQPGLSVSLADPNRYPLLAPYSDAATKLTFSLVHTADGQPNGILVQGPATIRDSELGFAVALRWPSGTEVREFRVNPHLVGSSPHRRNPRDVDKKPIAVGSVDGGVNQIGLGKLEVSSKPGEPLQAHASILGVDPAQQDRLRIRLLPQIHASAADPQAANLLSSIRISLNSTAGTVQSMELQSDKPFNLPLLAFRLEAQLGPVRLVRNYVLKAHPDGFVVHEQHSVAEPATGRRWEVREGESLSLIVSRLHHPGLSASQAMQRLRHDNPLAFIDGDINKLRAGVALHYPQHWASEEKPLALAVRRQAQAKTQDPAVLAARAARLAEMRTRLSQQQEQLAQAEGMSRRLEAKLDALKSPPPSRPLPWQQLPVVIHKLWPAAGGTLSPVVEGGGAALLLAATATATALALRRRRARRPVSDRDEAGDTVDALRQALQQTPDDEALRYRLLLLLVSQDQRTTFLAEAEEALRRFTPGQTLWQSVITMGREILPGHAWPSMPAVAPAQVPSATSLSTAAPPAGSHRLPEKPLLAMGELDELAAGTTAFQPAFSTAAAVPEQVTSVDNQALAALYQEMGDSKTANALRQR